MAKANIRFPILRNVKPENNTYMSEEDRKMDEAKGMYGKADDGGWG